MPPTDDHTQVTTPPVGDEDTGPDPRITSPTQMVVPPEYQLTPGAKLGEYQIEQRIGQGGMGVVFSAVHPLIGKRAAIKILKRELCADPHVVERFVDEARVVNQIGHPNIVDIFAFGEMPDGRSYFVMEWLKGQTLRERIDAGPLPIPETCRIVKQLARALAAAHEKGVIHRDLKPDNVFLVEMRDEPSTVKLLDFGIAKLARSDHRVEKTATGAIVGTPQYIAPEQAKGYAIDHRADIYALGGMLFEMLAGRPPFVADNAMEVVAKHLMETPVHVSTLAPAVTRELDELVFQMLAKQPDSRPALARVVEVLERTRERAGTQTPIPMSAVSPAAVAPAITAPFEAPRRRVPWLAIAGVPVAAIIAFLIVRALGSGDGEKPKQDVQSPPALEENNPEPAAAAGTVEPNKVEPAVEPKKVEPNRVEPNKVEPNKVEPNKVEPNKVEPNKVESKKVEPNKVEPAVESKKVEPKKVEPAVEPKKVDPSVVKKPVVKRPPPGTPKPPVEDGSELLMPGTLRRSR